MLCKSLREKFFNNLGYLYPDRTRKLNDSKEFRDLLEGLEGTSYHEALSKVPDPIKADQEPDLDLENTIDDS